MEQELQEYIKVMFKSARPEWDPSYEGVILYDMENHVWIGGDDLENTFYIDKMYTI